MAGADSIHLTQDKVERRAIVKTVMNICVPQDAGSSLGILTIITRTLLHGVWLITLFFY
jgi:hypothetical protein